MPAGTQAKLLRVLEDRKLRRLGSKAETPVDVRVIAATNRDPREAVASGQLRADLYYRLNVFNIQMPPLRSHAGDIPAIAEKMIGDMNEKHGCRVAGMTPDLLHRLMDHRWPGNVRELRNTIERAVVLAGDGELGVKHLPPEFGDAPPVFGSGGGSDTAVHVEVGTTVDEAERQLIMKTLSSTNNNKTRAAEILGISTKTLQNKLKEYARD
jgi:transcriptional regulator with PAS, ATPase and Fis domain